MSNQTDYTKMVSFPMSGKTRTITAQIVSELMAIAPIDAIEAGVVKYFLYKNHIKNVQNLLIKSLTSSEAAKPIFDYLVENNLELDILDVEKLFELLIPEKDKQLNGAVYTPSYIVDYIISITVNRIGYVCDPACGSGAFLLRVLKKFKQIESDIPYTELLEKYVYGLDILDYAIRRAKIILSLFLLINGEDKPEINFNLVIANSLKANWKTFFPTISSGFDFIVSNPPYVRIQDLSTSNKTALANRWIAAGKGNFNIYFAFFELGFNFLNPSGKLGYITPNNYFTSLSGVSLRSYLSGKAAITKIVNFNHLKLFENAQTYTCLTFLEKSYKEDYFEYCYVDDKNLLKNLSGLKFSKYYFAWLNNKKWRLMPENDYRNIKKIETAGLPLGKICPIKVGIATLKDTVFFVEDLEGEYCKASASGKEYNVEKSITRKVVKISSVDNEEDIRMDKRRIIFPYEKIGGTYKLIPETKLKLQYPNAYEYLLASKTILAKRDKGKKSYPAWYAWGRTQGMDFKGPRLYTRTFSHYPHFMLDTAEDNLFCNGYAVFIKKPQMKHVKAIQRILNSELMGYYVKRTSVEIEGDYQCYQKNFIENFSIPDLTEADWNYLDTESDSAKINERLLRIYSLHSLF
ncbi:MAG: N-6 DNA methylase [Candidatus Micrarchaeales archaeon]|nr:N-6 DNA methylase [Candidatus Micrarchaeales archaeon]